MHRVPWQHEYLSVEPQLPTMEELESLRKKLIQQIAEAEKMFPGETDGQELRTSRAALQCVEDTIKRMQDSKAA